MGTRVAIVTPASLREPAAFRPLHQALGLWEIGFRDFVLFSPDPDPALPFDQERVRVRGAGRFVLTRRTGCPLTHAHQNAGLFMEGRVWVDLHGWAPLESRLDLQAHPWRARAIAQWGLSVWAGRRLARKAERIICASDSIAENLRRAYPAAPPIHIIPNSIKVEDYPPTACPDPVVGVVGGFTSRWGRPAFAMALEVARRVPAARFRMVGSVDESQRRLAGSIPNVDILGRVDEGAFKGFFQTVSIALFPYPPWCRGGGCRTKLLQAGASGAALVSTPAGLESFDASPEVCVGSTPEELADHIAVTLAEPVERARRGRAARERVARDHDFRKCSERLAVFYDRV